MSQAVPVAYWLRFGEQCDQLSEETSMWTIAPNGCSLLERQTRGVVGDLAMRLVALCGDTVFLVESDRPLATAMVARGVLETAGVLLEFIRKLRFAVSNKDGEAVRNAIKNFLFASKEFGAEYEIATPHVMNGIRLLESRCRGSEKAYEILCESVHPNWAGRLISKEDARHDRIYLASMFAGEVVSEVAKELGEFDRLLEQQRKILKRL